MILSKCITFNSNYNIYSKNTNNHNNDKKISVEFRLNPLSKILLFCRLTITDLMN